MLGIPGPENGQAEMDDPIDGGMEDFNRCYARTCSCVNALVGEIWDHFAQVMFSRAVQLNWIPPLGALLGHSFLVTGVRARSAGRAGD